MRKADKGGAKPGTKTPGPEPDIQVGNVNTFGITRIVETALVNISRVELIWKILVSKLILIPFHIDCPL